MEPPHRLTVGRADLWTKTMVIPGDWESNLQLAIFRAVAWRRRDGRRLGRRMAEMGRDGETGRRGDGETGD